ncbi:MULTISPECIES: hypothetical protein [unclassified Pantoea]|uniref:hypothetical protein n=1 Tax=Pantoea TaxID=53335 RepID=UPI0011A1BD51|nr:MULTISPECIES: hypothetical protein [unclassified Pantoea]
MSSLKSGRFLQIVNPEGHLSQRENKAKVMGAGGHSGGPDNRRHFSVSLVIQPVNGKGDPGERNQIVRSPLRES